jgi:RNA polymerase sigma factor (sigma-70 family)
LNERQLDGLMHRLANGERAAFEPLFRELWPRALSAARRQLPPQGAHDAAQSTMLKLFARAADFRPGAPVLPWFYAIAANEIRAVVRSSRAWADVEVDTLAAVDDPERTVLDRELWTALANAIEMLDAPSIEAIAALLGEAPRPPVGEAAFRKRVSRAYAKLRVLLGGYGER